ncbi:MAG: motility protein A [Lachnospirales bacterium]
MELGSLIGLISGIIFILLSILIGAEMNPVGITYFADAPSVLIVIGGAVASTLIAHPLNLVISSLKSFGIILKNPDTDPTQAISKIIDLANLARKEGLLALEDAVANIDDEFLKKGIGLIVDGTEPDIVRNILSTELNYQETRHKSVRDVYDYMGGQFPGWGMIGTLIGLVMMLQALDDPSTIGPKMAVALITTFYGSVMANYICIPINNKMKINSEGETLMKEVLIEGMLSIQSGENPRIIEEKLKSFLSPALRAQVGEKEGDI